MWIVISRRPIHQTVGVSRRLPVAEVGAVSTPADASGHSGLFDGFAYHHAVFLELFRQYGIEKRIAT